MKQCLCMLWRLGGTICGSLGKLARAWLSAELSVTSLFLGHAGDLLVLQPHLEDFFPFPFPLGFEAEGRAQALETLWQFITGTMGCKHAAGKTQPF